MKSAERRYMNKVASLACITCRNAGRGETPAQLHHLRFGQGMAQRASNALIVPLCKSCHDGFHADQKKWQMQNGSELELLAQTIIEVSESD